MGQIQTPSLKKIHVKSIIDINKCYIIPFATIPARTSFLYASKFSKDVIFPSATFHNVSQHASTNDWCFVIKKKSRKKKKSS